MVGVGLAILRGLRLSFNDGEWSSLVRIGRRRILAIVPASTSGNNASVSEGHSVRDPDRRPADTVERQHPAEASPRWRGYLDRSLLVILLTAYLAPIWVFPFIPTQDGPSHLSNAGILLDFDRAGTRYAEYYQRRLSPIPNWTTHALLAGLMQVVSPPMAERLLVSAYIVAFVAGFRFYLAAFGPESRRLWPFGLLLVYNFSLLMGFYNFFLATALLWFALGLALRRRERIGPREALAFCVLLTLQYFCHLLGFVLSAAGAGGIVWLGGGRGRVRRLIWLGLAAVPGAWLTAFYLASSGFLRTSGGPWINLGRLPFDDLSTLMKFITSELTILNDSLFGAYELSFLPIGLLAFMFIQALLIAPLVVHAASRDDPSTRPLFRTAAFLGLSLALMYFLVPEHLGEHGGYVRTRLAPLMIMASLPCVRLAASRVASCMVFAGLLVLLAINLASVSLFFDAAGRDLAEFTAAVGAPELRGAFTMATTRERDPARPVDYLHHAMEHYCLRSGKISLQNYEAGTNHFPVVYRPEFPRSWDGLTREYCYSADVILAWDAGPDPAPGYDEVFRKGRLRVFRRGPPSGRSRRLAGSAVDPTGDKAMSRP